MDVCVVAAELAPWSKTGGLGDVAGALPRALAARGHRVMTVSPRYNRAGDQAETGVRAAFHMFGGDHFVSYAVSGSDGSERDGVLNVFVDNPCFHRGGIYGDSHGAFGDNLFRYALLCRAAIHAATRFPVNGRRLGNDTVFHANDWHTALIPAYLGTYYRPHGRFTDSPVVLGLHNLGHQGTVSGDQFAGLDLPGRWWPTLDMNNRLNPLKAGIVSADALVAVSPTYAREIRSSGGFGLENLLEARGDRLVGVLNGIDDSWNPAADKHTAAPFDADDLSGKAVCKTALQRELGLPTHAHVPVLAAIARLDHQKGIDLLRAVTPWLMQSGCQLVVLGSGSPEHEQFLRDGERYWPQQFRGWVGFNEGLAHRIEAGADIYLMPSRFEPCGLNQMYSMRYGTPPVVHATGGLADTVQSVDPGTGTGTGWAFRSFDQAAFEQAIGWALLTWADFPAAWREIQRRGMTTDFSWDRSAGQYERVYAVTQRLRAS
ncbi:MAG: glycogen synthase [Deltaproteobacteria bacterium]|nr:glycogen synthase [Deltaproteobacteria bacterium]